ncbi:MAG TPA: glycosyltransferase 87 family protein [Solirubrobacterales bacterium]
MGLVSYLGVLETAPRLGPRVVWGTIVVAVAGFAVAPVLLSHDVYSYVDYARLGMVHDLDPYVNPPTAAPADSAFAHVTWPNTTSAYGPLFTLLTYPLAWMSLGAAVATLKALSAMSVLALAAIVARLSPMRGIDPLRAAAFVALNPLVAVHVVGGAHNDSLAMLPAMAAVAAVLTARPATGGAGLLAAAATKTSTLFVAPFALLGAARQRGCNAFDRYYLQNALHLGRFLVGAAAAAAAIGALAYIAFGWDWLHSFGLAGENQSRTSYMSVPITAARLSGQDPDAVRIAALTMYAALLACLLVWTWRGGDWIRAAAWAAFGLLLATSWLLPWYLIWALPLAALSRDRLLQLLLLALTAFQLGARIPL